MLDNVKNYDIIILKVWYFLYNTIASGMDGIR